VSDGKACRHFVRLSPTRTAAFITTTDWIVVNKSPFLWESNPVEGKSADQRVA
jgi:hypothetical protein